MDASPATTVTNMPWRSLVFVFSFVLRTTGAFGQNTMAIATRPVAFELASVKRAGPEAVVEQELVKVDHAMVSIRGANLGELVAYAFRVKAYELQGPKWLTTGENVEKFDIQAKIPESATS